ncbi:hypothetical protein ABVT43_13470 [Aliikangiella sp. GXAS 311]|uniref:Uncharacterized protein n=3 Tax=Aliikangiella maris TaxID=3162458 RepID=A0ABV3MNZ2_9GAMM
MSFLIVALFSLNALAINEPKDAPKDVLDEAIELCKRYASEDQINPEELEVYLLDCVNSELETQGYKPVEKI